MAKLITYRHTPQETGGKVGNRGVDNKKKRELKGKKLARDKAKGVNVALCPSYINGVRLVIKMPFSHVVWTVWWVLLVRAES